MRCRRRATDHRDHCHATRIAPDQARDLAIDADREQLPARGPARRHRHALFVVGNQVINSAIGCEGCARPCHEGGEGLIALNVTVATIVVWYPPMSETHFGGTYIHIDRLSEAGAGPGSSIGADSGPH